jgi:hypothetical protein
VFDVRVRLIEEDILYIIGQVIYSMPEEIRVLFVVDQRLTAEERKNFMKLKVTF